MVTMRAGSGPVCSPSGHGLSAEPWSRHKHSYRPGTCSCRCPAVPPATGARSSLQQSSGLKAPAWFHNARSPKRLPCRAADRRQVRPRSVRPTMSFWCLGRRRLPSPAGWPGAKEWSSRPCSTVAGRLAVAACPTCADGAEPAGSCPLPGTRGKGPAAGTQASGGGSASCLALAGYLAGKDEGLRLAEAVVRLEAECRALKPSPVPPSPTSAPVVRVGFAALSHHPDRRTGPG